MEHLAVAVGEGRLTLEEYSARCAGALTARTQSELAHLTADLPQVPQVPTTLSAPAPSEISAILGNESRKGSWIVPPELRVRSVLGDCHLELQQAVLQQSVTTIAAKVRFGSITIFVPEGVQVRLSGRCVLGAKSSELHGAVPPGAPVIVLNCDVVCGSVSVRRPRRSVGEWVTRAWQSLGATDRSRLD